MGDQRSAAQEEENLVGTKLAASKVEKRRLERDRGEDTAGWVQRGGSDNKTEEEGVVRLRACFVWVLKFNQYYSIFFSYLTKNFQS